MARATSRATKASEKLSGNGHKSPHFIESGSNFIHEGQKLINELYEEGVHKVDKVQKNLKGQAGVVMAKVQEHPLASVCIAASIGYLMARILKK